MRRAFVWATAAVLPALLASLLTIGCSGDNKKDEKTDAAAEPGAIDPAIMGTADDSQLARAVDMIRGITLFNGRVVN